jgi:predicted component of viral defense system (DUF524 family)
MSTNMHTHNTIIASHINKSAQGVDALMMTNHNNAKKLSIAQKPALLNALNKNEPIKFSLLTTVDTPEGIHNQQYHYIMKASCVHIAQGIKPAIVLPWLYIL